MKLRFSGGTWLPSSSETHVSCPPPSPRPSQCTVLLALPVTVHTNPRKGRSLDFLPLVLGPLGAQYSPPNRTVPELGELRRKAGDRRHRNSLSSISLYCDKNKPHAIPEPDSPVTGKGEHDSYRELLGDLGAQGMCQSSPRQDLIPRPLHPSGPLSRLGSPPRRSFPSSRTDPHSAALNTGPGQGHP